MIPIDVLFTPLAIAGFITGIVVAFLAGRVRGDPPNVIVMSALGSGIALAALAWANAFGGEERTAAERGRRAWSEPVGHRQRALPTPDHPLTQGLAGTTTPARIPRTSQGARAGRAAPIPECYPT